jgi:tetratricopeptide (TPR) repeat protein
MSILIKALKQAERDHQARAAAAAPAYSATAVLETEAPPPAAAPAPPPAVRSGEALSLAPVEPREPAEAARPAPQHALAHDDESHGSERDDSATHDLPQPVSPEAPRPAYAPPSVDVTARAQAADAAAADAAAPLANPAPARAPAPAVPPPAAPQTAAAAPRSRAGTTAAPAPERAAAAEDLQAEERKAARQLMAPPPRGARFTRLALILSALVILAGAGAAAYWQGLFAGVAGLLQSAPPPPATRTLAERMQQEGAPHAAKPEKSTKARLQAAAPGTPAAAAGPAAVVPAHGSTGAGGAFGIAGPSTAGHGPAPLGADGAHASDGIHLRPPEATPERIRALLQDAYTAAGRGDTAAATRIYQQVIDLDHNNGDAWIGLAAIAANNGDTASANRDYRKALEIDPGDSVALGGLLGVQSGVDPQEAESRLRLLIVRDGAQPALQAALGKMLARQGRWLEAQETFFQAWSADPSQPDVAFNLAVTLERIRQPAAALSFYRRALELTQTHSARFDPAVAQERVAALTPKQP